MVRNRCEVHLCKFTQLVYRFDRFPAVVNMCAPSNTFRLNVVLFPSAARSFSSNLPVASITAPSIVVDDLPARFRCLSPRPPASPVLLLLKINFLRSSSTSLLPGWTFSPFLVEALVVSSSKWLMSAASLLLTHLLFIF